MRFRELRLQKDPECPICGENPTIHELIDYEEFCGVRQAEAEQRRLESDIPAVTPSELKARLDAGARVRVIDVREPHEWNICNLDVAELIPLGSFPAQMNRLDSAEEIVVMCRSGTRSAYAVRLLQEAGFRKVYNLTGGILAWSDEVDPSLPKY